MTPSTAPRTPLQRTPLLRSQPQTPYDSALNTPIHIRAQLEEERRRKQAQCMITLREVKEMLQHLEELDEGDSPSRTPNPGTRPNIGPQQNECKAAGEQDTAREASDRGSPPSIADISKLNAALEAEQMHRMSMEQCLNQVNSAFNKAQDEVVQLQDELEKFKLELGSPPPEHREVPASQVDVLPEGMPAAEVGDWHLATRPSPEQMWLRDGVLQDSPRIRVRESVKLTPFLGESPRLAFNCSRINSAREVDSASKSHAFLHTTGMWLAGAVITVGVVFTMIR